MKTRSQILKTQRRRSVESFSDEAFSSGSATSGVLHGRHRETVLDDTDIKNKNDANKNLPITVDVNTLKCAVLVDKLTTNRISNIIKELNTKKVHIRGNKNKSPQTKSPTKDIKRSLRSKSRNVYKNDKRKKKPSPTSSEVDKFLTDNVKINNKVPSTISLKRCNVVLDDIMINKTMSQDIKNTNNTNLKRCNVVLDDIMINQTISHDIKKTNKINLNKFKRTQCKEKLKKFNRNNSKTTIDISSRLFESSEKACFVNDPSKSIINLENACGNGEIPNSRKCINDDTRKANTKGCETCINFKPSNFFTSTVTHRTYPVVNKEYPNPIDCKSGNLIYLITCSTCHLQYVGETIQQLNKRFGEHRSGMRGVPGSHAGCKRIVEHWTKGKCKDSHFTVQIIENWKGDGRNKGKIDLPLGVERRKRETFWMLKLRTVYPYGLNDKIGDEYRKVASEIESIGKQFDKVDRKSKYDSCRHARVNKCNLNAEEFLKDLDIIITDNLPNTPNFLRINLTSMKKIQLKVVYTSLHERLFEIGENFQYTHWYLMACDIITSKIYKTVQGKTHKKLSKYKLMITFDNKSFDFLNLPQILKSDTIKKHMPPSLHEDNIPMVVYSLTQSIRSKIFNYGEFIDELNLEEFQKNKDCVPCPCENFGEKYVNAHHKHILTGDLSIIKNNDLKGLFIKGPNYREPKEINFETAKKIIDAALNKTIEEIRRDMPLETSYLIDWKAHILEEVNSKIHKIKQHFKYRKIKPLLKDRTIKHDLDQLLNVFVTVPIDKAQNNIAFVCKRLYAEILLNELASKTYEKCDPNSKMNIISNHVDYQLSRKLKVEEEFKELPRIYWTPKMHKTPIGTRFIIGNPKSSLKPLTKSITTICKLFYKTSLSNYYNKGRYFSGINHLWIVQNNNKVLESIDKINKRGNAKSISTYDFSSLYTNIPHDKLLTVLNEIVDFAFNGGSRDYVSITKRGAHFVKNTKNVKQYYNKTAIKDSIKFILENCYFTVGKSVYKQIIGIPMGSDPAPFFANFFLYYYESNWMKDLKKKKIGKEFKYGNIFRFIDDLIAINDGNEFCNSFLQIYPKELQLNKENDSDNHATFLDLDITITDNKFVTKLYDKRDSYNFDIVRLPYKNSNMPSKMFYATIGAELIRICRATSGYNEFIISTKSLLNRMRNQGSLNKMKNQGSSIHCVKRVLMNTMNRHWKTFSKYNLSITDIINNLLPHN